MNGMESSLIHDNFVAHSYELSIQDIEIYGHRPMFEILGAIAWIAKHRMPRYGQLDMHDTAKMLGIPFSYDDNELALGRTTGIPGAADEGLPLAITVRPERGDELLTFGHEVGHVFLGLVAQLQHEYHSREVEAFCDLFGREMVLQRRRLASILETDEPTVLGIMESSGADLYTTLMQLIEVGKLPRKMAVLTKAPADGGGKHAGQVIEAVVCFDCSEIEYESCTPVQKDQLPRLDLSVREDAYKLRTCGNEKSWVYN